MSMLLASYHMVWRGIVTYFIPKVFQNPIVKISFQHHAFFFCITLFGAGGDKFEPICSSLSIRIGV